MRARCASAKTLAILLLFAFCAVMPVCAEDQQKTASTETKFELPERIAAKLAQLQADAARVEQNGDATTAAKALKALADLYLQISDYKKALDTYEQALAKSSAEKDASLRAAVLNGLAAAYRSLSEKPKALEFYQQALALATSVGDERGQAEALNGIGWVHDDMGQRTEGLEFYNKALAIAEKLGDADEEAPILNRIGITKDIAGENDAALDFYQRALKKWHEAGDEDGEAKAINNLAILNAESGKPAQALEFYTGAQTLYREAGDRAGEAGVLNNLGVLYKHTGELRRAVECYERVLPLQRALGNRVGEAAALNNLGNAYYEMGQNQQALNFFEESLAIRRELTDPEGEAGALHNIGEQFVVQGDLKRALEALNEALDLWTSTKDDRGAAGTLGSIGLVYDWLGQRKKAAAFYARAFDLYVKAQDLQGEATVEFNLAELLGEQGDQEKSLESYQIALDLERSIHDRDDEARTLNNMGLEYEDLKNTAKALEHLEEARQIWHEIGDRNGEAEAQENIANYWRDQGNREKAREYYAQALPLAIEVGSPLMESQLFQNMMLNEKDRDPRAAVFYGKQAVNLVQHAREQMRGLEAGLRRSFLATNSDYYHDLAEVLIVQGRLAEAQQVLDLLKDQEYADYVRGGTDKELNPVSLTPAEEQARKDYEAATAQIVSLGEEWSALKRNTVRTDEEEKRYKELSDKMDAASGRLNDFYTRLYTTFGNGGGTNDRIEDVKGRVGALKRMLAKEPRVVALYTLAGKDEYSVIVITGSTTVVRHFAIGTVELNKKIAAFQQALRDRTRDPRTLAGDLYKIIVGPAASDLEQAKAETLIWSLDGVLRYVPMSALYDGSKYLMERYSLVTITPASFEHLAEIPDLTNVSAVGMGISQKFEDGLPPLPSVATELDEVIQLQSTKPGETHGALPGRILLNGDFTKKAMDNLLDRQVAVVHIASHFVFNPGDESQSYLLLAGKDDDRKGFHLTVADFRDDQRISLDETQLLTLSACETGMTGTASNGREIDGLGTTAQLKGAKAVISSLWEVNDASTGLLMADFYKRWVTGGGKVTKAQALRAAQLDLLQGKAMPGSGGVDRGVVPDGDMGNSALPGYAHPYYWAPFVLMGNWR